VTSTSWLKRSHTGIFVSGSLAAAKLSEDLAAARDCSTSERIFTEASTKATVMSKRREKLLETVKVRWQAALRRLLGMTPAECPGILQKLIIAYGFGELEPEPPWCEACGQHHWPDGCQVVCEIIVRSREEVLRWQEPASNDSGVAGD
jgi:hypothetical protein